MASGTFSVHTRRPGRFLSARTAPVRLYRIGLFAWLPNGKRGPGAAPHRSTSSGLYSPSSTSRRPRSEGRHHRDIISSKRSSKRPRSKVAMEKARSRSVSSALAPPSHWPQHSTHASASSRAARAVRPSITAAQRSPLAAAHSPRATLPSLASRLSAFPLRAAELSARRTARGLCASHPPVALQPRACAGPPHDRHAGPTSCRPARRPRRRAQQQALALRAPARLARRRPHAPGGAARRRGQI